MADSEAKVNKAKKLIHNIIETVSLPFELLFDRSNFEKLHQSPKAEPNST